MSRKNKSKFVGVKTKVRIVHTFLTPKMALAFLCVNLINRKLQDMSIAKIVRDIKAGRWLFNGDTICIDVNGNMIDGQHRCIACALSGIPVEVIIIYDVPENAIDTIDRGIKRKLSNDIEMSNNGLGEKYASSRAAIANKLLHPWGSRVYSEQERQQLYKSQYVVVSFVVMNFTRFAIKNVTQASVGIGIARAWYYVDDKDKLIRFCKVLCDPSASAGPSERAAAKFHAFLKDGHVKGVRPDAKYLFNMTEEVIRLFLLGKEGPKKLKNPDKDLFPMPHFNPELGIKNGATSMSVAQFRAKYKKSQLPESEGLYVGEIKSKVKKLVIATKEAREAIASGAIDVRIDSSVLGS